MTQFDASGHEALYSLPASNCPPLASLDASGCIRLNGITARNCKLDKLNITGSTLLGFFRSKKNLWM